MPYVSSLPEEFHEIWNPVGCWSVGWFGFNDPLRQHFSLYRAVSKSEGDRKRERIGERKISEQPPRALTASKVGPCLLSKVGRLVSTFAPPTTGNCVM